jgi:thioredoxin-related protein
MKRRALLAWAAASTSLSALSASPDSIFELSFGDFAEEAKQLGARKKKALLLFFEMEACPFCHRLHRDILSQGSVREMLQRDFVSIRVDIQGHVPVTGFDGRQRSETDFSRELKVRGTPTIVAFDAQGRELARLVGAPATPQEFLLFGRYALSGETASLSFAQYKRERRATP